jgi:hypothetical protein
MTNLDRYKFIFLCGLHRSGTSPLFRILRDHPQISGFSNTGVPEDEGQHLQTVFSAARAHGGPGRFGFAPEAHLTEESDLVTPDNTRKLFAEWSRYWDVSMPCLLEKSPPNLIRTRFLQALFPNSYFIVIVRHPVAVALATAKWAPHCSLNSLVEHWLHCHSLFERDRPYLRHSIVVQYEDLIQATQPAVERICSFLGLPAHLSTALNSSGNHRYFSSWRELAADHKGRVTYRRIVEQYESRVQQYGYSLQECEAVQPIPSSTR